MTVKDLLEISAVYDYWQVYKTIDEDTSEKIGDLFDSEMKYYNNWKVNYLRPDGDCLIIEIQEPKGE